jgi:hypothetical protein
LRTDVPDAIADRSTGALLMEVPDGVDLRPGPASMLCHSHDDHLDSQNSFVVAGTLRRRSAGWALSTERCIPGPATGGPLAMIKTVRGLRASAKKYLDRRRVQRPAVQWAAVDELWRQARSAH